MPNILLNRFELSQYSVLRARVVELDESVREVRLEIKELNKCYMNISPVLTGMPKGNEKRDKIAEFIIKLETDRHRLNESLKLLLAERNMLKYQLRKTMAAVNKIPDKQEKDLIMWHYFDGLSIGEVADRAYLSYNAAYGKINKHLKSEI